MSRRKRSFSKLKDERKCTCNNIEEQEDISYNINVNLEGKLDIQASPSCVGPGETINSGPHIACLIFFFFISETLFQSISNFYQHNGMVVYTTVRGNFF